MRRQLPIVVKFPAFFPPPMGFRVDHRYGLRAGTIAIPYWVDSRVGNDSWPGVDPEYPKETIQSAVTKVVADNVTQAGYNISAQIICSGEFEENVIVPYNAPAYVNLQGVDYSPWTADDTDSPCLTMRAMGWTIEGFNFNCPANSSGIRLEQSVDDDPNSTYKTIISNNRFDGLWGGLYGIDFVGAPHRVQILDNWFIEMHQAGNDAFCIMVSDTASGPGSPYQCAVVGNRFSDSDNYVGGLGHIRGFNVSLFQDNVFEEGVLLIPALYLDLRGGSRGYNIVTGNFFGGTYTNVGGYYAHAATPNSCWIGNTANPNVGTVADNGLTVLTPA